MVGRSTCWASRTYLAAATRARSVKSRIYIPISLAVVADLADVIRSKESAGRPTTCACCRCLTGINPRVRPEMDDGQCADLGAILLRFEMRAVGEPAVAS